MSAAVFPRSSEGQATTTTTNSAPARSGKPDGDLTGPMRHETIWELLTRLIFFFCLRTVQFTSGSTRTRRRDKTNLPVSPGMTGAITNPLPRPGPGRHGSRPHPLSLRISFPAGDRRPVRPLTATYLIDRSVQRVCTEIGFTEFCLMCAGVGDRGRAEKFFEFLSLLGWKYLGTTLNSQIKRGTKRYTEHCETMLLCSNKPI